MTGYHRLSVVRIFGGLALVGMLSLAASDAGAQQAFASPDDAASALASAVKSGARRDMLRVLGSDGEDIISSGDAVADTESRERFTGAWDTKHSVRLEGDSKAVIVLGNDDFPFPIP